MKKIILFSIVMTRFIAWVHISSIGSILFNKSQGKRQLARSYYAGETQTDTKVAKRKNTEDYTLLKAIVFLKKMLTRNNISKIPEFSGTSSPPGRITKIKTLLPETIDL